jgi:hypothetical protein
MVALGRLTVSGLGRGGGAGAGGDAENGGGGGGAGRIRVNGGVTDVAGATFLPTLASGASTVGRPASAP